MRWCAAPTCVVACLLIVDDSALPASFKAGGQEREQRAKQNLFHTTCQWFGSVIGANVTCSSCDGAFGATQVMLRVSKFVLTLFQVTMNNFAG